GTVATLAVINSTVANNAAQFGGGIYNLGTVRVTNATVAGNVASNAGGGIFVFSGTLTLNNSIVCLNTAVNSVNIAGSFTGSNNIVAGNPGLDLAAGKPFLKNNGGPTQTIALVPGGAAVNTGSNALALDALGAPLTTDQRGPG